MQLSMPQLAGLAEIGNTLFQHLRALRAQRNSLAEPFMSVSRPDQAPSCLSCVSRLPCCEAALDESSTGGQQQ